MIRSTSGPIRNHNKPAVMRNCTLIGRHFYDVPINSAVVGHLLAFTLVHILFTVVPEYEQQTQGTVRI
ncbi:hypothetical protein KUCAC02_014970 [Chaenocephalus aceratus]|nr:hypothetical protein KUCAC02_014970 [Chaenocephalus aceratus]